MSADWRAGADAAAELLALTGHTVDQRLARIAATAGYNLEALKDRTCPNRPAAINRWLVRHLDLCARTFCRPPPPELVALAAYQLAVKGPPRSHRKNLRMFLAAARHKARHPDASVSQIAKAIGYPQKTTIKGWLS